MKNRQSLRVLLVFLTLITLGFCDQNKMAQVESFEQAYDKFGGQEAVDGKSIIKLDIPDRPENGAVVPVEVEIEHPMDENNYISKITILTEKNMLKHAVTAHYTPQNAMAYLFTNIKLSETQLVYVLAETNSGKVYKTTKKISVSEGSCVEGKKTKESDYVIIVDKAHKEISNEEKELKSTKYKKDEVVKVVSFLVHPMETGFREDKYSGELKPKFFIQKATAFLDDKEIARFEFDATTSTNPKIIFPLKIKDKGVLKIIYENNKNELIEKTINISPSGSGWW